MISTLTDVTITGIAIAGRVALTEINFPCDGIERDEGDDSDVPEGMQEAHGPIYLGASFTAFGPPDKPSEASLSSRPSPSDKLTNQFCHLEGRALSSTGLV